ncbi:MAG TPA: sodium/solute symporter [Terriglobales bacterium]|nr:sodium/solute symporter [Terriglobales bacterium]
MKGLSAIDYAMASAYVLGITLLGASFYRKKATSQEYFLGGRGMWWLPAGISIVAADLSAISVMGTPAWSFKHNLELFWHSLGYLIAAPIVIVIFVPFYSSLRLYTAYEYLERRFNLPVRLLTSLLFLTVRAFHTALVVYAPALVINLVTNLPIWECVLFMGAITTVYTTLGGMKAVIWTDVVQFCTVMVGIILVFYASISRVPGGLAVAYQTALQAGKLHVINFSTDPRQLTSLWAMIAGGTVLCMAPLATDQAILQRLFTTKSAQDCRRSIVLQSILILPVVFMLYLAGTALFAFYYHNPGALQGLRSDDAILPLFVVRELPRGISGLILAAIFAASMAVMSASVNSLTTASTVDFYQRLFRPNESSEHYARVGRIGSVAWGGAVTVMALFVGRLGMLALAYNRVSSVISAPLLGIFLLAVLTRRTTGWGALLGAAVGVVVVSFVSAFSEWSFFWWGPIGVVATVVAGYLLSLTMTPLPEEKLIGLVYKFGSPSTTKSNGLVAVRDGSA